jgi:Cupin superfamily protein
MTFSDVCAALEKGTVIFNAAGAHIPKLAGSCLAASDATALPCSLNMYITAHGKRTSAPPHTDKQDVCVIQTEGCKAWKVYSVPDPSLKPAADIFARGKGDDNLPIHTLSETAELLVDTTLHPGDVLFIPAGFPHTTSTVKSNEEINDSDQATSIHLTFGIDHHIWDLDYLSVIRLSYRRARVALRNLNFAPHDDNKNPYTGAVNLFPLDVLTGIMAELPMGLLGNDETSLVDDVTDITEKLSSIIDPDCAIDVKVIRETVERIRQHGIELLDIHRDMYLEALHEGRTRQAEDVMTAHLDSKKSLSMSPERIQRLSLFRVKRYFDQINESKQKLKDWSMAMMISATTADETTTYSGIDSSTCSIPLSIGDKVEALLGGAYFPATITRISDDNSYDVAFFDGDKESGLTRLQIKALTTAISSNGDVDTSKMTAKQLKRWKKEQEKLQNTNI